MVVVGEIDTVVGGDRWRCVCIPDYRLKDLGIQPVVITYSDLGMTIHTLTRFLSLIHTLLVIFHSILHITHQHQYIVILIVSIINGYK